MILDSSVNGVSGDTEKQWTQQEFLHRMIGFCC